MIDKTSRYHGVDTQTMDVALPSGQERQVRYLRRRFLPPIADHTVLVEVAVTSGDRLDLLAARYAGDPLQFWRICDANDSLRPQELEVVGQILSIAMRTG